MKKPGNRSIKSKPWLALPLLWAGCGEEAPPYDVLPLRDTLQATPEVIAALPLETRREIARRFQESPPTEVDATEVVPPRDLAIDSIALAIDDDRETREQDALVLGEVETNEARVVVRLQEIEKATIEESNPKEPLVWHGLTDAPTASLEEAALNGHAGRLLQELSQRSNDAELVRITNLPLGAWAKDEKLYVNASWLVAMAALDEGAAPMNPAGQFVFYGEGPGKTPLTVDFNPYNLPESLLQCWDQVETTCQCGTTCAHEVTDPTFANAVEECAWVNAASANPAILCVLALLSSEDIRQCVASGGSCPETNVNSREDAIRFLANDACVDFLDTCLQSGYIPRQTSGSSSGSSCNGCNACDGCDMDGCSDYNNNCAKCNENCAECNQNWDECNQNCKDCNQNYEDSKNCGRCNVTARTHRPASSGPLSTTFWLTAPMVYVLYRGRRRVGKKQS